MPLADEEPARPHDADNAEDEDDNNNDDEDEDEDEEDEDDEDEDEEETATVACASAASSAMLASSPSAKHLATSSASAATSSASASASVPGAAPVAARSSPAAASASTAASSSLLPIAAPPFQASSPPPASPAAPPSTSPSSLSARLAISPAVAATPLSPPQPNYDDDEEEDDDNGDNDGKTGSVADAQSRSMSSHSFALSAAHHGLAMGYPASTASPSVYVPAILSGGHYASYATVTSPSQPMESYRASSAATGVSTLLQSMQAMDSMAQQGLGQASASLHHTMSMSMSASLAAVASPSSFYPDHSVALPSNYTVSNESMSRYPLPHDPRILGSRGGPKKEIKRRTKTGCLTCRKRRIKCDETHPTCNNCKKSKRDCLGYDPVFRQQAAGGSANSPIQPAPANQPTFSPSAPSPSSLNSASAPSPRAGNSYGSQPSMLPTAYASAPTAPLPSTSASHTTAGAIYSPPTSDARPIVKPEPSCVYQSAGLDPAAKHISSICSSESPRLADVKPLSLPDADSGVETMKVDEILNLLGPAPPQYGGHTEEGMNEIIKVYHEMYAGGLSLFFETSWYYFLQDGKMTFPKDINLIDHMASFLKVLEAVQANDHAQMTYSGILEMRIVWELACTVYQVPGHHHVNGNTPTLLPAENDGIEAKNRLRVVEALLNGDYLETNPFSAAVSGHDQSRTRQFDFWYCLAEFVRRRDDPDEQLSLLARETMLGRMRQLLDKLENRDLLYSIAVVRELAPRFEPTHANHVMHNADERDPRNRLAVAIKFIQDEAQVTGGMTNVVRRVSDIALRAFVTPGFNVARIN